MSETGWARQLLTNILTLNERFNRIDTQLTNFGSSVRELTKEHYGLSERVANIEGRLEGSANR